MVRALFACLIATAIISALVYANAQTNFLPDFNLLGEIQSFNARLGLPDGPMALWVTHVFVGVFIYGITFAIIQPILPGSAAGEGLWFGVITFLVMMTIVLPLGGHQVFAHEMNALFIGSMAAMNLLYGLIVGVAFDALTPADD